MRDHLIAACTAAALGVATLAASPTAEAACVPGVDAVVWCAGLLTNDPTEDVMDACALQNCGNLTESNYAVCGGISGDPFHCVKKLGVESGGNPTCNTPGNVAVGLIIGATIAGGAFKVKNTVTGTYQETYGSLGRKICRTDIRDPAITNSSGGVFAETQETVWGKVKVTLGADVQLQNLVGGADAVIKASCTRVTRMIPANFHRPTGSCTRESSS